MDFKFKGLKNGQHIILVKDGGYLLNEDGSDVGKSDLQDGDRIITVKQAKERDFLCKFNHKMRIPIKITKRLFYWNIVCIAETATIFVL